MAIISHSKRFVFIHVYKTGGTSIRHYLSRYVDDLTTVQDEHGSWLDFVVCCEQAGRRDWLRYYSFSVVRHPYDWLSSLYRYIQTQPEHPDHMAVKNLTGDEFVLWLVEQSVSDPRQVGCVFYGTQSEMVLCKRRKLDKIMVFNKEMQLPHKLARRIKAKERDLPHVNKGEREPGEIFFTAKGIAVINKWWKDDFKNFGFKTQ